MKIVILVFLFASFNAWADSYSVLSIKDAQGWSFTDGVPQGQTSLKTIIDKDGHKTITDGKDEGDSKHTIPVAPVASQTRNSDDNRSQQQLGSQTPLAHAREILETRGWDGLVEAPAYMDMADSIVAQRNCTPGNKQPKFRLDQSDLNAAYAYVRRQLETGGFDGAVLARKYTDMINGLVAAQNCTLAEYQQQREIKKMRNELRQLKSE